MRARLGRRNSWAASLPTCLRKSVTGFLDSCANTVKRFQPETVGRFGFACLQKRKPSTALVYGAKLTAQVGRVPLCDDRLQPQKYESLCVRGTAVRGFVLNDENPRSS